MSTQEQEVEFELEELLLRIVPGLAEQWQGATPDSLAKLERLAGRPLPPFYRWFLSRMGQSMGPLAYASLDFSAQRVLRCYTEKQVVPEGRFLLIAHDSDEMMPLHLFYDLDAPARGDALVAKRDARGGELFDRFETLREMLAWGALLAFKIDTLPQRCSGTLQGDAPDLLAQLDPVMNSLGFTKPITTGPYCGLYERYDAVMLCKGIPGEELDNLRSFTLGGGNAGTLRRLLGEITKELALEVEVDEWTPAPR